jgi:hypothetical protein
MSALTLMSVIAPAAPSVPKGSSGEDASGFQDMLTALSGEDTASRDQGRRERYGDAGRRPRQMRRTLPASCVAPTQPPVPLVLPAAPEAPADSDVKASTEDGGEERPVVLPPAPDGASGTSDDPPVMPLPADGQEPGAQDQRPADAADRV